MKTERYMDYNSLVKRVATLSDVIRVIRLASVLWLGYLVALALIDQIFPSPRRTSYFYYILLAYTPLLCLGLSYWSWAQDRLKKAFVPLIITIITVLPVAANLAVARVFALGPPLNPEGSVLRLLPFLFVGFLLVAWQYSWQHILFIILGLAGINLAVMWISSGPGAPPFQFVIVITLVQTVIFLPVGFSISYLMNRMRKQQQSLEAANVRLTHYAATLEHLATSQERNRLARELHDTLAHTLSGLSVQLETIKAYWDVEPQTARSMLDKSMASAHSGLEETRRALKALRASPLEDLGLVLALRKMAENAAARGNLTLDLSIADKITALSPDVEQCVYRVAQEALTNVLHHARAKNLAVRLEANDGKLTLLVRDDGIGFDPEKAANAGHFGLAGIRERALLAGAEIEISSQPGAGTTIRLTFAQEKTP